MKPSDRACLISAAGAPFFTAMIAVGLQYMLNFFQMTTAWQHRGIWMWRLDRDEEERRQR